MCDDSEGTMYTVYVSGYTSNRLLSGDNLGFGLNR